MTEQEFHNEISNSLKTILDNHFNYCQDMNLGSPALQKKEGNKFYRSIEELVKDAQDALSEGFDGLAGGIATNDGARLFFTKQLTYSGLFLNIAQQLEQISKKIKDYYSNDTN